jgi:hypothetical protein
MSLAMYAAPFNENSTNEPENDLISQKRQHNKTQKKYPKDANFNSEKVNNILETIHNNSNESDGNTLGDFSPPPKPLSSGVNKTTDTEDAMNKTDKMNTEMFSTLGKGPQPNSENDNYDLNDYHPSDSKDRNDAFYKKMLPNYGIPNESNKQHYNVSANSQNASALTSDDTLLKKINYMIHLLEEQQDEKTNNVTEEVVLYSFLGIFIIFVIDSFVRVGKYVR